MAAKTSGDLMKDNGVETAAKKVLKRKLFKKVVIVASLSLLILISAIYLFLYIIYAGGRFTVTLDKNLSNRKNVFLSESGNVKGKAWELSADTIDYMDNISIKWLPDNLNEVGTGSHNGDNYIAYTFYVINVGEETVDYWYEIDIDDTIKNVDEAARIMIYRNGTPTVYAKKSKITGESEPDTKKFTSEKIAVLEHRENFKPNTKDRYTVVLWIEGDDPECKNDLLGGEIKLHMDFTEEHIE